MGYVSASHFPVTLMALVVISNLRHLTFLANSHQPDVEVEWRCKFAIIELIFLVNSWSVTDMWYRNI